MLKLVFTWLLQVQLGRGAFMNRDVNQELNNELNRTAAPEF